MIVVEDLAQDGYVLKCKLTTEHVANILEITRSDRRPYNTLPQRLYVHGDICSGNTMVKRSFSFQNHDGF